MNAGRGQKAVTALSLRGLQIRLRRGPQARTLIENVDLDLPAGEITGLVGASGSGKTLTALALMGLTAPGVFEVRADALHVAETPIDLNDERQLRGLRGNTLAMVFQDPATALDPVFRIGHQVAAPLRRQRRCSRSEARTQAAEALAAVGFDDPATIMARYPHELSGGQRQRCVIAMAQALRPAVLFADEPSTALDTVTQQTVLGELERLARECGTAVLLVSHDLRLMARYARNVNVIHAGRIVDRLPGRALHEATAHDVTRRLVAALPRLEPSAPPTGAAPQDPTVPARLEVRDLRSGYRQRRGSIRARRWVEALHGVSLDLAPGRTHGIAGASGSGKSTLARTLVQLLPARGGQIRLDGRELLGARGATRGDARRRIQLVFQDPGTALSPRRSVAQTLAEAATHFGLDAGRERLRDTLAAVDLEADTLDRLPYQFSSGQRQRIAIARALICEPDVLVADEALSALDVPVQAQILALLRRLRAERRLAILLISHDLAVLRENAETMSIMHEGRFVESGSTERVFTAPAHEATRRMIAAIPRLGVEGR